MQLISARCWFIQYSDIPCASNVEVSLKSGN